MTHTHFLVLLALVAGIVLARMNVLGLGGKR